MAMSAFTLYDRQGGAQLVADVGHYLAPAGLGLLETRQNCLKFRRPLVHPCFQCPGLMPQVPFSGGYLGGHVGQCGGEVTQLQRTCGVICRS